MLVRTTLAGLAARKLRMASTAVAIMLGVGFVAGTLIFSDTARAAVYDGLARSGRNVDVAVRPAADAAVDATVAPPTVDAVRRVPGVGTVSGRMRAILPMLDRRGRLVSNFDHPGVAFDTGDAPGLRPFDVTAGRAPTGTGEVALAVATAERTGYPLGDQITVVDRRQGRHQLTVVGTVDFGSVRDLADQTVLVLDRRDLVAFTDTAGFDQVVVSAAAGVSAEELAGRVRAALPAGLLVQTGDRFRFDLADDAVAELAPFLTAMLIFAVIACVVAAFVIANTFTILTAQRVR